MKCLFCDEEIVDWPEAGLGSWKYRHADSTHEHDHPAVHKPEPMTEAAHKERAWFNEWGFRRTTRPFAEQMMAKFWFDRGYAARREWDET